MVKLLPNWLCFLLMEIYFKTKKLADICNVRKKANTKLGTKNAKFLSTRLVQLKNSNQLGDFKFDSPHPLKGNKKDQFAITIYAGFRLVFEAINPVKDNDGNIIWIKVVDINIIYIGDYHE